VSRRIFVVDDEQGIRAALGQLLEFEGYEVRTAGNAGDGIAEYEKWRPNLVFMDVKMAGMDGLEGLRRIKQIDPSATVVMISGHATIQTAVEATQLGAYDILEKPLDTDRILVTLRNALAHLDLHEENTRLRDAVRSRFEIVGTSYAIRAVTEKIERVGKTPARVLITGENGTGKELVARAIHAQSTRAQAPFVEVNCAAIPSELIESELFGHMKGSFTGAVADRAGKFEQAHGGTLFLDEIGDMSLAAQAKVLRVLQDGVVTRIGGSKPIQVDVRVLAATNKDLPKEIAAGRFREDLYFRLNVVPLRVPALRERSGDIPILARHFVALVGRQYGRSVVLEEEAIAPLLDYPWPGNVRELRNLIERLIILSPGAAITAAAVAGALGPQAAARPAETEDRDFGSLREGREDFERRFIARKLRESAGNVLRAAQLLGLERSHLYRKMRAYGLRTGPGEEEA